MLRIASAVFLTLLIATPYSHAQPKPAGPPDPEAQKLTRRERKDRIAKLAEQYREFLLDVEPIMSPLELNAFLSLETDPQRDVYIVEFWRRRDVAEGKTNGAFKDIYYDRIEFVKEEFKQVASDRSRVYLLHGEPNLRAPIKCPGLIPIEVWLYSYIPGLGRDIPMVFFMKWGLGDYVLFRPPGDTWADLMARGMSAEFGSSGPSLGSCQDIDLLAGAVRAIANDPTRLNDILEPPKIDVLEDVRKLLRSAVISTPGATKLDAEFSVRYPGKQDERTDAQMTVLVPRSQLTKTTIGGVTIYSLDVTGEVLRDDQMFENYRYRFDYPGDMKDEKLPVIIDRFVRPGSYKARIRINDVHSTAEAIVESEIVVPEIADTAEQIAAARAITTLKESSTGEARIRIIPLAEELLAGIQKIETIVFGRNVAGVEFYLNGRKVATRREPPYTLDLDLGLVPMMHKIKAIAIDAKEQPITGDDIVVNVGNDPFRVRIVEPRGMVNIKGPTRVEMSVQVPEGKKLGDVQLFLNETRVATLYANPFVQTVIVPDNGAVGYLRAVATLKDQDVQAEDVVMINTPAYMEEIDVHLVELPTTVSRDGRPVLDLTAESFRVFDEGKPVAIAKFEYVKNLPLSIGMAIDTSGSMLPRLGEAQKAAAQFFDNVMRPGDSAFLVGFDSQPSLIQRWSPELKDIHFALARLRAEQYTALYDAIVYSLYNFIGSKGQKALVMVTDGQDTSSKFSYDQALEYARRSGVPIYLIGMGIRMMDIDVRNKLGRFATQTGGAVFYIERTEDLRTIYSQIHNELRSQYLLGFYPPEGVKSGGKWRQITVQVSEGKAKTIRGYYP